MSALHCHIRGLLAALASSYVTLGVVDGSEAQRLWAPYAALTVALAVADLRSAR